MNGRVRSKLLTQVARNVEQAHTATRDRQAWFPTSLLAARTTDPSDDKTISNTTTGTRLRDSFLLLPWISEVRAQFVSHGFFFTRCTFPFDLEAEKYFTNS
jgi:hypothetical protein